MSDESDFGVASGTQTVRFERLLPGPIERVWRYLVESDKRGQWLASGDDVPAQVGGEFQMFFHHESLSPERTPTPERFKKYEDGISSMHRVTRYEPPHTLGFTWSDGADGGRSDVLIELAALGDKVRFVLTHRKLSGRHAQVNVSGGWHTHLAVLDERLNGRVPVSFWTLFEGVEEQYEQRYPKA